MLEQVIIDYGILALAAAFFLDSFVLFFPTSTLLFAASLYTQNTSHFSLWVIYVLAFSLPPIGNRIVFEWGKRGGRRWLLIHGYKFFISSRRIIRAEQFIEKYGDKTIFFTSLFTTTRPFAALISGSLNMKGVLFSIYNILGVWISVSSVVLASIWWGDSLLTVFAPYWGYIIGGFFCYIFGKIGYHLFVYIRNTKTVLVVGNGAREHAFCNAVLRSEYRTKIYNISSHINPGIQADVDEIYIEKNITPQILHSYIQKIKPDIIISTQKSDIRARIPQMLEKENIPNLFPPIEALQIETSQFFMRTLLEKYKITPKVEFFTCSLKDDCFLKRKDFFERKKGNIILKTNNRCLEMNVFVGNEDFFDFQTVEKYIQKIFSFDEKVILEEKIKGSVFSFTSITDGEYFFHFPPIQNYKRAYRNKKGTLTSGMGSVMHEEKSLSFLTEKDIEETKKIQKEVCQAIQAETKKVYKGILRGTFVKTTKGIQVLEYNVRFGDSETLIFLPLLLTDFLDLCFQLNQKKLKIIDTLEIRKKAAILKYIVPKGFPQKTKKGIRIKKQEMLENENEKIFMENVLEENGEYILSKERALAVLGVGENLAEAYERCEKNIQKYTGAIWYRKDIGLSKKQKKIHFLFL